MDKLRIGRYWKDGRRNTVIVVEEVDYATRRVWGKTYFQNEGKPVEAIDRNLKFWILDFHTWERVGG